MVTFAISDDIADKICAVSLERLLNNIIDCLPNSEQEAIDDLESVKLPLCNIAQIIRQSRNAKLI